MSDLPVYCLLDILHRFGRGLIEDYWNERGFFLIYSKYSKTTQFVKPLKCNM